MATESNEVLKKITILCLHGYRQNGKVFSTKLGAFRKIVNKHADMVFITAGLAVSREDVDVPNDVTSEEDLQTYGWWFSKSDDSFNAHDHSDICTGFEQSVDTVRTAVTEHGPFDGVLGFSQGAAFAVLLLALQQQGKEDFGFKFAVLIAGFKSRSTQHSCFYDEIIDCPSLHVFGETDRVIPEEMSEELVQRFNSPAILRHPGGHFAPATSRQKTSYLNFFDDMIKHVNKSTET